MMSTRGANRLVLLDRDGTINREKHYLSSPDQVELITGAADGVRLLNDLGLPVVVISNQSGVARGYFNLDTLEQIHNRLHSLLAGAGARVDAIYFCPHLPEDGCYCRKPQPGMAKQAAEDFQADLRQSFVVGDKRCDLELGTSIGATTILVRTGYGADLEAGEGVAEQVRPHLVADDLLAAAQWIRDHLVEKQENSS